MQHKTQFIVGILIAVITAAAILITQTNSEQPLTNHDLHQQLSDLNSFAVEVSLMLDQYKQDKLDFNYLKYQAQKIDKNIDDFYSQLESTTVDASQKNDLSSVETLIFQFGLQLKFIESSQGDAAKLNQIRQSIQQLHQQITESEQHYA